VADLRPYPGAPRWAKVFGVILAVLVLLFAVLLLSRGPHGPGRHTDAPRSFANAVPAG
jgi:hypothetical protein